MIVLLQMLTAFEAICYSVVNKYAGSATAQVIYVVVLIPGLI
jgi:hypothetical protein